MVYGSASSTSPERWLERMLAITVVLNVLDALFTLLLVLQGWATEANPLMEPLITLSPVLFVAVKLSLVSLGVLVLWRLRDCWMATVGSLGVATIYGLVVVHHLRLFHAIAVHS